MHERQHIMPTSVTAFTICDLNIHSQCNFAYDFKVSFGVIDCVMFQLSSTSYSSFLCSCVPVFCFLVTLLQLF